MTTATRILATSIASIILSLSASAATLTDQVTITPAANNDATIDFRSSGVTNAPGLTLSFIDGVNPFESAAISKLHRVHGLWQWQGLDGSSNEQLLMQLGNWGTNSTPHLMLMDALGEPSVIMDGGEQQNGRPAVFKLMASQGPEGTPVGATPSIELHSGSGPNLAEATITLRDTVTGAATVVINAGSDDPNNPPSITIGNRRVVTSPMNGAFIFGAEEAQATGGYAAAFGYSYAYGHASAAFGWDTAASGGASVSFGGSTQANGSYSAAFGMYSVADGTASVAFGYSHASNEYSSAFNNSSASGDYSASFNWSSSTGLGSVSFGNVSLASGQFAAAFGEGSHASGPGSAAFGSSRASGAISAAFGYARASGEVSAAFGFDTHAQGYSQFVIGQYNIPQGDPDEWIATDDLFIVGNGGPGEAPSNALTVKKNGNAAFSASLAAGPGTQTTGTAQTVVGKYNNTNPNNNGVNHTEGVFIIGTGTGPAANQRANAMRVLDDGSILIKPSGDISMGEFESGAKP